MILLGVIQKSNQDNTKLSLSDKLYEEKLNICSSDMILEPNFFQINKFKKFLFFERILLLIVLSKMDKDFEKQILLEKERIVLT